MNTRPVLYIFVGFPGAGKTSIAKYIHEHSNAVHIWADQERQKMFGYPTHSQTESQTLYLALNIKAEDLLKEGKSVIYDTNFNYKSDRDLMKSIAEKCGADIKLIWVNTPKEIAKSRALEHTHRDRNGYIVTMSEEEFNHLCDHTEIPTEDENPIKIDGTKFNEKDIKKELKLN